MDSILRHHENRKNQADKMMEELNKLQQTKSLSSIIYDTSMLMADQDMQRLFPLIAFTGITYKVRKFLPELTLFFMDQQYGSTTVKTDVTFRKYCKLVGMTYGIG